MSESRRRDREMSVYQINFWAWNGSEVKSSLLTFKTAVPFNCLPPPRIPEVSKIQSATHVHIHIKGLQFTFNKVYYVPIKSASAHAYLIPVSLNFIADNYITVPAPTVYLTCMFSGFHLDLIRKCDESEIKWKFLVVCLDYL